MPTDIILKEDRIEFGEIEPEDGNDVWGMYLSKGAGKYGLTCILDYISLYRPHTAGLLLYPEGCALAVTGDDELVLNQGGRFEKGVVIEGKLRTDTIDNSGIITTTRIDIGTVGLFDFGGIKNLTCLADSILLAKPGMGWGKVAFTPTDNDELVINQADGFKNGVVIKGKLKTDDIEIRKIRQPSDQDWGIWIDSGILSCRVHHFLLNNPAGKGGGIALTPNDNDELVLNAGDGFKNGVVVEGKNGLKVPSISITGPDPKIGSKGPALVATDKNELVLNQADSFANGVVVEGKNGLKLKGSEGYDINNKLIRNVTSISGDKIVCKKQEYKVISQKKYGGKVFNARAWVDTTTIDLLAKIDDLSKEIEDLKNRVKQLEEAKPHE